MNKTVLAMLLSSLTTSAWWAFATWPCCRADLGFLALLPTTGTVAIIVKETLELLGHKP